MMRTRGGGVRGRGRSTGGGGGRGGGGRRGKVNTAGGKVPTSTGVSKRSIIDPTAGSQRHSNAEGKRPVSGGGSDTLSNPQVTPSGSGGGSKRLAVGQVNTSGGKHQSSSINSNPPGQNTSPSQGTPSSQATVSLSRTRLIPVQYPTTSTRPSSQRLAFPTPSGHTGPNLNLNMQPNYEEVEMEDEEDEDADEEEEIEGHDQEVQHGQGLQGDVVDEPEGQDYQQLLENILALPGRENLPLLSKDPIPGKKTLW